MSGDLQQPVKVVTPFKYNEKPWDLWVSEIGHSSPLPDEPPAELERTSRRECQPYKAERASRTRRSGVNRLRYDVMSLHGLFPQMDNLNAAICHMCGVAVKCSAAYRHLVESHGAGAEPLLPPPPPTVKLKSSHSRNRHKKEAPPPPPPEVVREELRVCAGEDLPVVSIQDDLPLGDHITDDIFDIMNSEGIQSADDITNEADWKNIIRDIGNMQDINFSNTSDNTQSQDSFASADAALSTYGLTDADLSSLQFAAPCTSTHASIIDNNIVNAQLNKPVKNTTTPTTKSHSRSKTSKSKNVKYNVREYDPNKHCGVLTGDVPKPCTRSLTCKAHALSLRRMVEGRLKPFDQLLAEHRASKDPSLPAPPSVNLPPLQPSLLVNTSLDLSNFNSLTTDQQVNDIYTSLLNIEEHSMLPDTSTLTSLLSQPPAPYVQEVPASYVPEAPAPYVPEVLAPYVPEVPAPYVPEVPAVQAPPPEVAPSEEATSLVPADVCWYASCPRPLAVCTFNMAHAGTSLTIGKKCATIRSNMKSLYSRSQSKSTSSGVNYYNFNQNIGKSVHTNSASKSNKPEVRKVIVTCGRKEVAAFGDMFVAPHAVVNGHADDCRLKASKLLDLDFMLDPLLADEKC